MSLTRDSLLKADLVDITEFEWFGLTLYLRPLGVTAALKSQSLKGQKAVEHLLQNSLVDESGKKLFDNPSQVTSFLDNPMNKINLIVEKINEINEIDQSDEKEGEEGNG